VKHAWAGTFEGLLHRDIGSVNVRLVEICRASPAGLLLPFGTINPRLPDWDEDLRRCHEVFKMPGIRLYPNFHGYKLSDPCFVRLAELAARRRLVVQLTLDLEDRRTVHPMFVVPPVDLSPLPEITGRFRDLRLVLLNGSVSTALATRLAGAGRIYFDLSHQEGLQGLTLALNSVPIDRLLFGSHAPLFVHAANLLKLRESLLTDEQLRAIAFGNAAQILNQLL
jgi:predicted TIM-barrel fold metal-dependent hydrolase